MKPGQFYKSRFTTLLVLCTAINKNVSYLFEGVTVVGDKGNFPGEFKTGWICEQFQEANDIKITY